MMITVNNKFTNFPKQKKNQKKKIENIFRATFQY